ncbi:diguanylate cyclase domain-containing protein [Arenimonas sp.]|uniref:GGDEF domain-containing protein n=1 Tax=Arenimonas sp. TaxID=1872635 RepID=UPI0039E5FEF7
MPVLPGDNPLRQFVGLLADSVRAGGDLESLVRPLLELMETVTGLESTYVTAIDEAAGVQHVLYARNSHELQIPEGLSVPWGDTLCKRALEEGRFYTDDVADCWGDSDAAAQLGIATYTSTPIRIEGGKLYGTLCAASGERRPLADGAGRMLEMFSALIAQQVERERLMHALQQANDALAATALLDTVTGLPNRRALMKDLARRLAQARRDDHAVLAAFVDLDNFKTINDQYGHDVGDRFLVAVGEALTDAMRGGDFAARMGGDEFIVLGTAARRDLRNATEALCDRLLAATSKRFHLGEGVSIDYAGPSIGVAVAESGSLDGEALINAADAAMYAAKRERKGLR